MLRLARARVRRLHNAPGRHLRAPQHRKVSTPPCRPPAPPVAHALLPRRSQFHLDDDNALSVLAYAVEHLKVSHIIVAGHTLCGGAEAALAAAHASCPPPPPSGPLARWLGPLTEIAREYEDLTELIEANVRAQVNNVAGTDVVRAAWADNKRKLQVHGWIYDLGTGRFRDMGISVDGPSKDDVL